MANPLVSVGMPVYNGATFLRETLDSILGQTYTNFELIVGDNASTDQTEEICREYAERDARLRYFRHDANIGAAANYNFVFHQAKGEFFRWSNADDLLAPELHEECLAALLKDEDAVICYGKTEIIDETGTVREPYNDNLHLPSKSAARRFRTFFDRVGMTNAIYGLMRADAMRHTALFGDGTLPAADIAFMAELTLQGTFVEIPRVLFYRRMHEAASSFDRTNDELQQVFWRASTEPFRMPRLRQNYRYFRRLWQTRIPLNEKLSLTWYILRRVLWQRKAIMRDFLDLFRERSSGVNRSHT